MTTTDMSAAFAAARLRGEVLALTEALTSATERAERAEADLTAARALLREVVEHLPMNERTRPTAADLRARIEALLGRTE